MEPGPLQTVPDVPRPGRPAESIQKGARGFLRYHAFRQLGASFGASVLALLLTVVGAVLLGIRGPMRQPSRPRP